MLPAQPMPLLGLAVTAIIGFIIGYVALLFVVNPRSKYWRRITGIVGGILGVAVTYGYVKYMSLGLYQLIFYIDLYLFIAFVRELVVPKHG